MEYKPSSSVLILTICSLNKEPDGEPVYDHSNSISSILPKNLSQRLHSTREKIRKEITTNPDFSWAGMTLKEIIYNENVVQGKDFSGDKNALYRPAINRYKGRFYTGLGKERSTLVGNSPHHMLILSGLYGLLRPFESIQLYSCPLIRGVKDTWLTDGVLKEIIIDYIKSNKIKYLFDFIARDDYRDLIPWKKDKFKDELKDMGVIRYRAYDLIAPNDQALGFFGEYLKDNILSIPEEKIRGIKHNKTYFNRLKFFSVDRHFSGLPQKPIESDTTKISITKVSSIKVEKQSAATNDKEVAGPQIIPESTVVPGRWQIGFGAKFIQKYDNRIFKDKDIGADVLKALMEISEHPFQTSDETIKIIKGRRDGKYEYRFRKYRIVFFIDEVRHSLLLTDFGTHNDPSII